MQLTSSVRRLSGWVSSHLLPIPWKKSGTSRTGRQLLNPTWGQFPQPWNMLIKVNMVWSRFNVVSPTPSSQPYVALFVLIGALRINTEIRLRCSWWNWCIFCLYLLECTLFLLNICTFYFYNNYSERLYGAAILYSIL